MVGAVLSGSRHGGWVVFEWGEFGENVWDGPVRGPHMRCTAAQGLDAVRLYDTIPRGAAQGMSGVRDAVLPFLPCFRADLVAGVHSDRKGKECAYRVGCADSGEEGKGGGSGQDPS
jgi:hypothetical protein